MMGGAAFFAEGNLNRRVREDRNNRWVLEQPWADQRL
jgi:hypothetical protein